MQVCSGVSRLPGGRQPPDREAGFLSDPEDELTDSHRTGKHSEVYSATVPSIDSAMSSWDSSGFDAGYGSQGERGPPDGRPPHQVPADPLTRRLSLCRHVPSQDL